MRRDFKNFLKERLKIRKTSILSREAQIELARRAQEGCSKSRDLLVETNIPLVLRTASSFWIDSSVFDFDDLVQEGALGIMRAIKTFEIEYGLAFSTYAKPWIEQHMRRFIDNNRGVVRIPVYLTQLHNEFNKLKKQDTEQTDDFYIKLLAFENNTTEAKLRTSLIAASNSNHVVIENTEEDEKPFFQLEDPSNSFGKSLAKYDSETILRLLIKRERYILEHRMNNYTLSAIADELGISREQVRQVNEGALRKLRSLTKL